MTETQLTPHFTLDELTVSSWADEHNVPNVPVSLHRPRLLRLAQTLEKVRTLFGRAVVVSSAYRNPTVNRAVGGVPTSAHAMGYAADIHVAGFSDIVVARRIRDDGPAAGIKWDQLIYEGTASHPRCVHLSIDPRFRQQVLTQHGGPGTTVLQGIVP